MTINKSLSIKWQEEVNKSLPIIPNLYKIHFVGIGGTGMSGIAEILLKMGYEITGSDLVDSEIIKSLSKNGAKISIGHNANTLIDQDVLVVSSAIDENNPEVIKAHKLQIPVIRRAEMLAELVRYGYGITVAGAHGKTTTTTLIQAILCEAGLDPTFIIGGKVMNTGTNAQLGCTKYIIAEADESDASFKHIYPISTVVTNIDRDHIQTYNYDMEKMKNAYVDFMLNVPFYGLVVACGDDENLASILPRVNRKIITYGYKCDANYKITNVKHSGMQTNFKVTKPNHESIDITLNIPGKQNILNSTAAIVIADSLKIDELNIKNALLKFEGVDRRFNIFNVNYQNKNFTLIDDYGHHPTEIKTNIETVRSIFPNKNLLLIFQPHRYSRTKDLFFDFVNVLEKADISILQPVYPANEKVIEGFRTQDICNALRDRKKNNLYYCEDNISTIKLLFSIFNDDDVVLIQGAGSIGKLKDQILNIANN